MNLNYSLQKLPFAGTILFLNYPLQELSFAGTILCRSYPLQELSFFTTVPCQQAFSSHRLEPASFEHLVLAPLREPKSHHGIAVRSKFMKNLQPQTGPGQNSFFSFFILVIIAFIIFLSFILSSSFLLSFQVSFFKSFF